MRKRLTPGTRYPGRTLGITGLLLAILFNVIGLFVSIIAFLESKNAGVRNVPATAGIVVGAATFVLGIVAVVGTVAVSPWDSGPVLDVVFSWLWPITWD